MFQYSYQRYPPSLAPRESINFYLPRKIAASRGWQIAS